MLINLISLSNYQSYNVILARTLGLYEAVYLNALIEINEKAIRKNKLQNEHFLVDRKYIQSRTTLGISQQKKIEETLESIKIIHKNNDDCIKVNVDILFSIMKDENEDVIKDLSFIKQQNKTHKDIKKESILKSVKNHINQEYPPDMIQAYSEWLDVIQNKFGFVSKQMILNAQTTIDNAANHDAGKAIDMIHIASANGWKDMKYAVKVYNAQPKIKPVEVNNNISIGESF